MSLPESHGGLLDDEDDCQACSFVESPSGGGDDIPDLDADDGNEYEEEDDE